jgi:hypothetical protein
MNYPKIAAVCLFLSTSLFAEFVEESGIDFPTTQTLEGKELTLNGVATRKAMGIIKVFAAGFYLETPTHDPEEVITSEQVKYFHFHYLTDKATAEKLSNGFKKAISKANSKSEVASQMENIERYASWVHVDMKPGSISESYYIPGEGLTVRVNGEVKGTINDPEFIAMYYRYQFGEDASSKLREGFLGLKN